MANEFVVRNGLVVIGDSQLTGSLNVSAGITGSLFGTSSWANNAVTASFVNGTASFSNNATSASYAATATSASFANNANTATTSATASYLNTLNQDLTFNGNLILNGSASITYLNVLFETASVIYSSGSNQLGDTTADTQTLIGTVLISGSQQITGSLNAPNITGSLFGTASWAQNAVSASYVLNAVSSSFSNTASFATSASRADSALSSSFATSAATASYVLNAVTASFASTASAVNTLNQNVNITGSLIVGESFTAGVRVTANTGVTVIYSLPTASYEGAFFAYTARSASNARAGHVVGIWSGTEAKYAETTTTDFGSTAGLVFGMSVLGANLILSASATTNGWTVNTIVQSI